MSPAARAARRVLEVHTTCEAIRAEEPMVGRDPSLTQCREWINWWVRQGDASHLLRRHLDDLSALMVEEVHPHPDEFVPLCRQVLDDDEREDFDSKWKLDPATGCHIWLATCSPDGYGQFNVPYIGSVRAHRYGYERSHGPIPDGLVLDHFRCDNPPCVNPDHLRPVTKRENTLRGNSFSPWNLAKTECINGHPLNSDNVYVARGDGSRCCRTCNRESVRRYKQRQRAVAS